MNLILDISNLCLLNKGIFTDIRLFLFDYFELLKVILCYYERMSSGKETVLGRTKVRVYDPSEIQPQNPISNEFSAKSIRKTLIFFKKIHRKTAIF